MSKLKLMDYEVVSEMISIGVTPEEYLPRINSLTAPAVLIRELMHIGVECDYVIEDGDSFVLRCPEYSEHYNDFLEEFIQSFRYKSKRVQNIIESYKILSKRDLKSVPTSSHLVEQNTELRKEIEKLREEIEELREDLVAHKEVNADLSRRNASLDDKLEELQIELDSKYRLSKDLTTLTDELMCSTKLLSQAERDRDSYLSQGKELQIHLHKFQTKCHDLEAENAQLLDDLNSYISEAAEDQEILTMYKSEVSDNLYSLQEELREVARTVYGMIEDLTVVFGASPLADGSSRSAS